MYQVLARKWRPQTFEDLVGQPHVARTLRNAITSGRIAHAFVFAGVRGTGKTTVARLLAKCLNCHRGVSATPCNVCDSCREITEGRSLDVIELDAATRTQVDNIRELQEVIAHGPARDRTKVLILDEAHMLSRHSANALLKVVEEPPPHVVFILATTEIQKILPTIVSRCQLFEFRRVPPREVASALRQVCQAEGVTISDRVLEHVARAGEGSVRDSLSALERLLACCGRDIEDEEALRVLGEVRVEVVVELVSALAAHDAARLLRVLDLVVEEGHDLVHFWGELVAVLRDLLLARTAGGDAVASRSADEMAGLERAAEPLSRQDLTRAFQIVADLEPGLKSSSQPRFLFEATLIRLADLGAVRSIEALLAELDGGSTGAAARLPAAPTPPKKKDAEAPRPEALSPGGIDGFRELVRSSRPMVDVMLGQARSMETRGEEILVSFPAAAEALRGQLERADTLAHLERCASQALGGPVRVRFAFDPAVAPAAPPPPAPGKPIAPAAAAEPPAAAVAAQPDEAERRRLLEHARQDPGVRKLLFDFGAQVIDIRPLPAVPLAAPAQPPDGAVEELA